MQPSAVQYNSAQPSSIQYTTTVQPGPVQYVGANPEATIECTSSQPGGSVLHSTHSTMLHSTGQFSTVVSSTVQHNTGGQYRDMVMANLDTGSGGHSRADSLVCDV